jgi:hypothetical protein
MYVLFGRKERHLNAWRLGVFFAIKSRKEWNYKNRPDINVRIEENNFNDPDKVIK